MIEHPTKDQVFIRKLTDIILANLGNENFGVKELIHESGMSHYGLNQRLHAINNKNINQFIREVRLQKALEMLQNEKVTASEVAYKVGFSSPAYFNTRFHEYYGYTPGEIKRSEPGSYDLTQSDVLSDTSEDRQEKYSMTQPDHPSPLYSYRILLAHCR